ncbi:hypothetical protein ACKFKG_06315 [Phormidesmis sp. 146-35]
MAAKVESKTLQVHPIFQCNRRARNHGRQLPPGLEFVDSWVDLDYLRDLIEQHDRIILGWIRTVKIE